MIFRDAGDAVLQNLELPLLQCQLVNKNDVEDNPTDRQQAISGTVNSGHRRHLNRHPEFEDGDGKRSGEANQRGDMRFKMKEAESPEQDNDGYGGEKSREHYVMEGVVDLGPHRDGDSA